VLGETEVKLGVSLQKRATPSSSALVVLRHAKAIDEEFSAGLEGIVLKLRVEPILEDCVRHRNGEFEVRDGPVGGE